MPGLPTSAVSIALIEVASIAVGYAVADALVKTTEVRLLEIAPVTPGKLCILYTGDVASLELAHAAGLALAGEDLIAEMRLAQVHPGVFRALNDPGGSGVGEALGVLECSTVASGLLAADAAAKATGVELLEIQRAAGIGGKATILLTGTVGDVEVSLEAGQAAAEGAGGRVRVVRIAGAHADLKQALATRWSHSAGGGA